MTSARQIDRGLSPFDAPVYLEHGVPTTVDEPVDQRSRPVLAFLCRSFLVVAVAGALPFLTDVDVRWPVALLTLVHLPATVILDRSRDGVEQDRMDLAFVMVALDVALIATLAGLSDHGVLSTTLGPLLIAFHRWLYGRRAAALSVVLVVLSLIGLALGGEDADQIDWFSVGAVAAVGSLLVWMVDDQAIRHSQTTAGLHLMATRAEAVLAGIGDAIVSTDRQRRVVDFNPAAAHLLGNTPDDARGRHCQQVLGFENDAGPLDCNDRCALLGGDGTSVEVRRQDDHGHRQPLLVSAVALRDHDGEVIEVVHLLRDITTIKQADDAKTLFLATASHELKTPLSVISGYAQVLRLPHVGHDDRVTALDAIQSRTTQLVHIVDRLLMSSRIDAGHIDLLLRPIPVDGILRAHTEAFSAATATVDLTVEDGLPPALVDHAALATVIDHLLDNAHKYSPREAPIGVRARFDDDRVHLDVRDGGIGMSQAQMDLCFERFWQAEGTDVRRFGGTGIGLYIVESLVRAMHGEVAVRANPGRGVTFTVSLRRRPLESDPEVALARSEPTGSGDGEASMIREFMRQVGVLPDSGDQP